MAIQQSTNEEDSEDQTIVHLDVKYGADSKPTEIGYHHPTFGLMKFDVKGDRAIVDPEWNRLTSRGLKDRFTRWVTTGDVFRSVQELPFIESVEVDHV